MSICHQRSDARLIMAANTIGVNCAIPDASLEALRSSDLLVFEEHRPARQALKAAGVHRDYLRLTEHEESSTIEAVKEAFTQKKSVVYMSDQGVPVMADPGQALLKLAYAMGVQVTVIPGPSSLTAAIAACPFIHGGFHFAGFLPRSSQERKRSLLKLQQLDAAIVIMDTPYRMKALLADCLEVWHAKSQAFLAMDISGPGERFHFAPLSELYRLSDQLQEKMNFVLILPPK